VAIFDRVTGNALAPFFGLPLGFSGGLFVAG
jgi:hypothetical protein